jgi:hypothetical protein
MPIIASNQTFSGNLDDKKHQAILAAMQKQPMPTIKRQKTIDPKHDKKKLLLLPREIAYVNRQHVENPIQFIGAKNLGDNLFLLLWNPIEEYLAIHVDTSRTLDLFIYSTKKIRRHECLFCYDCGRQSQRQNVTRYLARNYSTITPCLRKTPLQYLDQQATSIN